MPASSVADVAFTAGARIGRYFALVSAVPSAVFVLFVYALIASGAWTGEPDLAAVWQSLRDISIGEASVLLVVTLATGLMTHPLQFATTQLLEGYWGTSSIGRALAVARVRHYRAHAFKLDARRLDAKSQLSVDQDPEVRLALLSSDVIGDPLVPAMVDELMFYRAREAYPPLRALIMPTRLGNVLRRYEAMAGAKYGLDAIAVAPHLALVGAPARVSYVRDTREQLDLAVRLCSLSLLAAVIAFVFLVADGPWVLVAGIPYALAYLSYRGAVAAAHEYGTALSTLIDLDRFRLYAELHIPLPTDTSAERRANTTLSALLRHYPRAGVDVEPTVAHEYGPDRSVEVRVTR